MVKHVDSGGQVHLVTNIRKPRKWRRYEYLQSSGTLWIDTGVKGYMNHTYELEFLQNDTGSYRLWGVLGLSSYIGYNMSLTYGDGWLTRWNSTSSGEALIQLASIDTNKHKFKIVNGLNYFDNVSMGTSSGHNTNFSINYNLFLFTINPGGTTPTTNSKAKIYSYKDYDASGNLVRHMVPAQYNGQYGMWDLVEDKFYPNKGTGSFTVGPEMKNYDEIDEVRKTSSLLPAGVELYDYILSSGTLWIDTGIYPKGTDAFEIKTAPIDISANYGIFGSRTEANSSHTNSYNIFTIGNTFRLDCIGGTSTSSISANTIYTIKYAGNNVDVNGTSYSGTARTNSTLTCPVYLFAINRVGNVDYPAKCRIYYYKQYSNNQLVRNLVPCTYLGEPGMWDTVENKFYRNQGTGLFTLGNKITLKEYEYLQGNGSSTYIDTNYYPNVNTKLILKRSNPDTGAVNDGEIDGSSGQDGAFYISATLYAFDLYQFVGNIRNTSPYIAVLDKGTLTIDNNIIHLYSSYRNDWVSPRKFYLLGCNKGDGTISYNTNKIYYCQLYENNQLIRDFIPVSYNGTPGLWDKVEWKFYANAGTGSFTLGPEKARGVYPVTEAPAYGVQWTENLSSTTLLRIGSHNLHRELPILSQFKGCVVNPSTKQVVYWLDENDWSKKADGTSSILDGTDGLVMVHIPRFWGKSGKTGTTCWVKISPRYIDSTWQEIPEMFVGAYRATVSNSKAYSVVNTTIAFRGGNNRSSYDTYLNSDPFRSDLGKPRTNLSRANMRTYCRNNNMEMLNYEYYKWIFYWCYVIEYANFNCLATFNSMLTNDGFRLGGLGSGVTTWSNTATSWSGYNATYPITPNGYCNDIGNRTGIKALTIPLTVNGSNTIASKTFYVPRWRGFDNPFGDTWTNLDGCNVQGDSAGNPKNVYTTTDPTKYADGTTSNMTLAGHIIHSDGYVKEFDLGTTGNIFAASVGGTETTYKCDYNYTGSKDTSFRWLMVGGSVNAGGLAGLGYLDSHFGVGATTSTVGFRPIVVV